MKGYSKETIKRYRQVVHKYAAFAGIEEIEEVTIESVRNLFYWGRTVRHWSPNSFILFHKTLGVFFRWCVKEGCLGASPLVDIETPKLEKKLPAKLSKQEALRVLEVVYNYPYPYKFLRYRNHAIFALFIFTGIRKKELLRLKFMDVDVENGSLFIRQGKGSKDRIIPMSYTLAEILLKYLGERKRLNKTCPDFFTSLNRNVGFTETGLKRLVEKIRDASGLHFGVHMLRHTFATLMLEGGCDIYSLSKMMGHSDIKTTTIYLAATVEHLRSQIEKHPLNNESVKP